MNSGAPKSAQADDHVQWKHSEHPKTTTESDAGRS
jgi:hypothetical protein